MATKFDQLFKEFSGLTHDEKKQKVIAMLEYVKDKIDFVNGLLGYIRKEEVSDDFLNQNFQLIMKSALTSQDNNRNMEMQKKLQTIANIQEHEKQDGEDADEMLNSI